jgi:hypothetical protein
MNLKTEVKRRNTFEKGTPCIYYDGITEITGEVVTNKRGVKAISPYDTKGLPVTKDYSVVPRTWFNVRKFNSNEKHYTKTHADSDAMQGHIDNIIKRNGSFSIADKVLHYYF